MVKLDEIKDIPNVCVMRVVVVGQRGSSTVDFKEDFFC
jgi:hypothetical protein